MNCDIGVVQFFGCYVVLCCVVLCCVVLCCVVLCCVVLFKILMSTGELFFFPF